MAKGYYDASALDRPVGEAIKEEDIRPRDLFERYLALAARDVNTLFADQSNFVAIGCPACASARQREEFRKLGLLYVSCRDCGSLYMSPRPPADAMARFYECGESVRYWSTDFYRRTQEARRERMFKPRAELVSGLLNRPEARDAVVFADIGSGYGVLLEEVQSLSVFDTVVGIEPNEELADVCVDKGFTILRRPLEDLEPGAVSADVASSFEVIEHVSDPLGFLSAARRVLRPDGRLVVTTLTCSGFDIQLLWDRSDSVYPPHHINLLSVEGMQILFDRAGFHIEELLTPGKLDVDIVAGALERDPGLELPRFVRYLLERRTASTHDDLQEFLSANRLSSHIRVVATPKATCAPT